MIKFIKYALEYPKLKSDYDSLLKKHQELEAKIFGVEYNLVGISYKDAIQDAQILLVQYKDNQAMLAVVATFVEYLKQSLKERMGMKKEVVDDFVAKVRKRSGQKLSKIKNKKTTK